MKRGQENLGWEERGKEGTELRKRREAKMPRTE